ncbi:MAG: GNAT family N-acetyltransferase [Balneolaceae bacterium]
MNLREAETEDLVMLQRWDNQPHVIAANPNDDWDWDIELRRSPGWREFLIAELNRRPIGFIQIMDPAREESHYWGEIEEGYLAIDIWIGDESDLRKGYGTMMMKLALNRCFSVPGVKAVVIDPLAANTKAHRFYERLGFRFIERRSFGEDDCFVYWLDYSDWNHEDGTL